MPYWRLFYHVVWGTKGGEALIKGSFESSLHQRISEKAKQLGSIVHAVNGMEDHIHIAASVPPNMALSEFIRHLKGGSSHFMNHSLKSPTPFTWQPEYGVVSFGQRQLAIVVQYIREQKQHHRQQTTIPLLEQFAEEDG